MQTVKKGKSNSFQSETVMLIGLVIMAGFMSIVIVGNLASADYLGDLSGSLAGASAGAALGNGIVGSSPTPDLIKARIRARSAAGGPDAITDGGKTTEIPPTPTGK